MECLEDVRSILQGVIFAQSAGAYTLENSEQIAPVVRRILNRYPQLNGNTQSRPVQQQPKSQLTNQSTQPQKQLKPREVSTQPDKVDDLIQRIKCEKTENEESSRGILDNIEVEPAKSEEVSRVKNAKSTIEIEEPDIEAISLPLE